MTDSAFDELTVCEREIATLAANGLTNPDLAARLVLFVRAVENHVQRTRHVHSTERWTVMPRRRPITSPNTITTPGSMRKSPPPRSRRGLSRITR